MEANNMKAMREALKKIHQMGIDLRNIIHHLDKRWEVHLKAAINIYQTAERAYLSPPRNCDVGSVQEQGVRFNAFCKKDCDRCSACPKATKYGIETPCYLIWAQMPYESQNSKD